MSNPDDQPDFSFLSGDGADGSDAAPEVPDFNFDASKTTPHEDKAADPGEAPSPERPATDGAVALPEEVSTTEAGAEESTGAEPADSSPADTTAADLDPPDAPPQDQTAGSEVNDAVSESEAPAFDFDVPDADRSSDQPDFAGLEAAEPPSFADLERSSAPPDAADQDGSSTEVSDLAEPESPVPNVATEDSAAAETPDFSFAESDVANSVDPADFPSFDEIDTQDASTFAEAASGDDGTVAGNASAAGDAASPAPADRSAEPSGSSIDQDAVETADVEISTGDEEALPTASEVAAAAPSEAPAARAAASSESHSPSAGSVDKTSSEVSVSPPAVSQKTFQILVGYAAALTILFLFLLLTGRVSLSGEHPLESLPDIEPLKTGEFREYRNQVDGVETEATLPPLHDLHLGESRRFGDVKVTILRVTRDIVQAFHPSRKEKPPEARSNGPVLKLWFKLENVSESASFAPWDVALMCHRHPKFTNDESTVANSWLKVVPTDGGVETRVLNFMHNPESEYSLVGLNGGRVLKPGDMSETFAACAEDIQFIKADGIAAYRWRLQIRKGVHLESGHGVTTLVDVHFSPDDIEEAS